MITAKQLDESLIEWKSVRKEIVEAGLQPATTSPKIIIRSAGTTSIPRADFKSKNGSRLTLINPEINDKDGVLFSDDEKDFEMISKMTAGDVSGSFVTIGSKEYPVLAIQRMGTSSRWNFVLDYDESRPTKPSSTLPRKKNESKKDTYYIDYVVELEDEETGDVENIKTEIEVSVTGYPNGRPRGDPDFEGLEFDIEEISLPEKGGMKLKPEGAHKDLFFRIHDSIAEEDDFFLEVYKQVFEYVKDKEDEYLNR